MSTRDLIDKEVALLPEDLQQKVQVRDAPESARRSQSAKPIRNRVSAIRNPVHSSLNFNGALSDIEHVAIGNRAGRRQRS